MTQSPSRNIVENQAGKPNGQKMSVLNITNTEMKLGATQFAEILDESIPVPDFGKLNMALTYPYELDNFQKQAILKLEEGHHVLVVAHTSAGKTAVAEYAIAMSLNSNTRSIYTSPTKALANQKFYDFRNRFGNVGLLTGDFQTNPKASCVVMTTEILLSMIYNDTDVFNVLSKVVFDEMHYINDPERGHVWEEILMLLPDHVQIVMLSATVSNPLQFAEWLGHIKKRKVYVVSTLKRPVPLLYFLYRGSNIKLEKGQLFQVLDEQHEILVEGYNAAAAVKAKKDNDSTDSIQNEGSNSSKKSHAEGNMWNAFIQHLDKNDKLPAIVFILSKRRCNYISTDLLNVDLTTDEEKKQIESLFETILSNLPEEGRTLLQVTTLQSITMKGIGIHHGGMIPLLKEAVEMLFTKGYIKVLFSTETIAVGVNLPARTVVLEEITKFDGARTRLLTSAECIQMAGRAGRRGIDEAGTVVIMCKEKVPELATLKRIILGSPDQLSSQFQFSYSTILNLLRNGDESSDAMIENSFIDCDKATQVASYKRQLEAAERDYSEVCRTDLAPRLAPLAKFYDAAAKYIDVLSNAMPVLLSQPGIAKQLVAGKILIISTGTYINQLAVYLNDKGPQQTPYQVLVLKPKKDLIIKQNFDVDDDWFIMLGFSAMYNFVGTHESTTEHDVICIAPKNITAVTKTNIKMDLVVVDQILNDWAMRKLPHNAAVEVCASAVEELVQMSQEARTGASVVLNKFDLTQSRSVCNLKQEIEECEKQLDYLRKFTDVENFDSQFALVYPWKRAERKVQKFYKLLSLENKTLYPCYKNRYSLLRTMNYINKNNKLTSKGVAASWFGKDDFLVTELLHKNVFEYSHPEEIAALLSAIVYKGNHKKRPFLCPSMKKGLAQIKRVDQYLHNLEFKHHILTFNRPARVNGGLVEVIHEWAKGESFSFILKLTDADEGSILNCIHQLHELLGHVQEGATHLKRYDVAYRARAAANLIKRDIACTPSLYTKEP